jgi:membrane associated rhomboid family serine protease
MSLSPLWLSPLWLLLLSLLLPLPFGTDRRGRRVPWVTYTLIGLNVCAYLFTGPQSFGRWGLVPSAPHFAALLTGLFLHVSLAHLFWNMVFLALFGPHVEEALGGMAFLALYLGGGIAAGLLHMAIILTRGEIVSVPLVGASGAISAILAPFAIRFHRAQIRLVWLPALLLRPTWGRLEVPAVLGLGLWLLQNIGGGLWFLYRPQPGGTAYWAHIGGFAFGLVAAELTGLLRDGRQDYLLQDARASGAAGVERREAALRQYRAFLDHEPANAPVRVELARLLAAEDRDAAGRELADAVRVLLAADSAFEAAQAAGEARRLGLELSLAPRERLRLAHAASEAGDWGTAAALLRAVIAQTPDAPEDEMARLRLGQLLLARDPDAAQDVLTSFLHKYPHSPWIARARELLSSDQTNV